MKFFSNSKITLDKHILKSHFAVGLIGITIGFIILSFFYYKRSASEIENFFYKEFKEKARSGLYSVEANLNEKVNFLIYKSNSSLTPIPQNATPLNYIRLKTREILKEFFFVNRVLFLDFEQRKCSEIYPDFKVINIPRTIISFEGLNLSRDKPSKNLFYLYVPDTRKQDLDSIIWGLVVIPVKVEKSMNKEVTIGEVFFLFNLNEMIKDFIPEKELAPVYKFFLTKKGKNFYTNDLTRIVPWDNKNLIITFDESLLTKSSWRQHARITKGIFFIFILAVWITMILAAWVILYLFQRTQSLKEEMYKREKEDKINMEALAKLMGDTASSRTSGPGFLNSLVAAFSTIIQSDKHLSFAIYDKTKKELLHQHIGDESSDVDFNRIKEGSQKNTVIIVDVRVSKEEIYEIMLHDKQMEYDEDRKTYYESVLRIIDLGAEALAQRNLREGMELKMFRTILKLLGSKDHYTCEHSLSMAAIAEFIADKLVKDKYGFTDDDIRAIKYAGFLHDIGKMGIPDEILNKQGRYSQEEMAIMIKHPLFTEIMLEPLAEVSEFYDKVLNIAIRHHERGDGSGYPYGIIKEPETPSKKREYIDKCNRSYINDGKRRERACVFFEPIMQVLAVADVLDATLRDRPYKSALSDEAIIGILKEMKEKGQIDAYIIDETVKGFQEIKKIRPSDSLDDCESFPGLPYDIINRFLFTKGS